MELKKNKMRQIKKLRSSGGSFIVTIDKEIIEAMSLKEGDSVIIDVVKKAFSIKSYRCMRCSYRFAQDDEYPYCPACECKDIEEVKDE